MDETETPLRPEGIPVLGVSLSEEEHDFWDTLTSRSTLSGRVNDEAIFPRDDDETCSDLLPSRATCSRLVDHPGRHLALLRDVNGVLRICSAWPGTHRPRLSDLEES